MNVKLVSRILSDATNLEAQLAVLVSSLQNSWSSLGPQFGQHSARHLLALDEYEARLHEKIQLHGVKVGASRELRGPLSFAIGDLAGESHPQPPIEWLLTLLLAIDTLMLPGRPPTLSSRPQTILPELGGGSIAFWKKHEHFKTFIGRERLPAASRYRPALRHLLDHLGFAISRLGGPSLSVVSQSNLIEVNHRLQYSLGTYEPFSRNAATHPSSTKANAIGTTVGLFSLRANYSLDWAPRSLGTEPNVCGAVAEDIRGPAASYLRRLKTILQKACLKSNAIDILVLPELAVNPAGHEFIETFLRASSPARTSAPALIFAGKCHSSLANGAFENKCVVWDPTGRKIAEQSKQTRYTVRLKGFSKDPSQELVQEDIQPSGTLKLIPTVAGCFCVLICSDFLMFQTDGSLARTALDSSADWIIVPSHTPKTHDFLSTAKHFARDHRMVLFSASYQGLEDGKRAEVQGTTTADSGRTKPTPLTKLADDSTKPSDLPDLPALPSSRPPRELSPPAAPALAAFIWPPLAKPFGLWFDEPTCPQPSSDDCWHIGITKKDQWEGLIVNVAHLVESPD